MTNFLPQWPELIADAVRVGIILLLAIIALRLLRTFTNRLIHKAVDESASRNVRMREQQTRTVAGVLYSAGVFVILLIALLTTLEVFHFNIVPIAGAAGLASLGIGIGAQGLVKDVINGFFIVFEDQFVVGDLIRVGDTLGRVEHMTLRRTVIRSPQGAVVTIPNGQIQQVSNLSRDWSQMFMSVPLAPAASVEIALAALDQVASEFRADAMWSQALVDGPRVLGVDSLGPTGATLLVQLKTAPLRQDDVARELRRRITARFEPDKLFAPPEQRILVRYPDDSRDAKNTGEHSEVFKP
jgi:moderate conductance mechanosensitive channel